MINIYNKYDVLVVKFPFEVEIDDWQKSGLAKPTILKAAIATVSSEIVLTKLGQLSKIDIQKVTDLLQMVLI